MTRFPLLVEEDDLSVAWAKAFLVAVKRGTKELAPLVVVINEFKDGRPKESKSIRNALDQELIGRSMYSTHTVANTIFPERLWNADRPRDRLFERYGRILGRLRQHRGNHYGLYFERLAGLDGQLNQLDHIIRAYRGGIHRRTALQASVFRPERDHTMQPRRGFPCLDHVAFLPLEDEGLEVSATYTMQHLLGRAYGNYLGLTRLGRFMAHEMGLELRSLACTSMVAKIDHSVTKASLTSLIRRLERFAGSR